MVLLLYHLHNATRTYSLTHNFPRRGFSPALAATALPSPTPLPSTDPQQEAGPVFLTNLFLITCPSGGQICRAPPAGAGGNI